MISHKYKCIFIHIPRAGGTSIEKLIQGKNQWLVDESKKHLTTTQAKKIYQQYWNDYFKFSIVRNPYDRFVSCLYFKEYFGIKIQKNIIDVSGYKKLFGFPTTIEHDYRFYAKHNILHDAMAFINNSIYSNILIEPIDKIFKFEELNTAVEELCDIIKIPQKKLPHVLKSNRSSTSKLKILTENKNIQTINSLYLNDFKKYQYTQISIDKQPIF
jgi:hypothetical protein